MPNEERVPPRDSMRCPVSGASHYNGRWCEACQPGRMEATLAADRRITDDLQRALRMLGYGEERA